MGPGKGAPSAPQRCKRILQSVRSSAPDQNQCVSVDFRARPTWVQSAAVMSYLCDWDKLLSLSESRTVALPPLKGGFEDVPRTGV